MYIFLLPKRHNSCKITQDGAACVWVLGIILHTHTHISQSAEQGFTEISERLILKVAAKTLDNEKFPLDVPPVAGGAERRRSCQSSIACCFILLSLESQSHLIWALRPAVPDPNLPPPSPWLPRRHGNEDQPCGTHVHACTQAYGNARPQFVVFKEENLRTFDTYYRHYRLKCGAAVDGTVRDGCTNHGLGLCCLL